MKLTIDRTKWLRGEGSSKSKLLRHEDGKMCCLGFMSLALGYKECDILEKSTPELLEESHRKMPQLIFSSGGCTGLCTALMVTNDADISQTEREAELIKDFAIIGVEVEFVN